MKFFLFILTSLFFLNFSYSQTFVDERKVISEKGDEEYLFKNYDKRKDSDSFTAGFGFGYWPLFRYEPTYLLLNYNEVYKNFIHHMDFSLLYKKKKKNFFYGAEGALSFAFHTGGYIESDASLSMIFFRTGSYFAKNFGSSLIYLSSGLYSVLYTERLIGFEGEHLSFNGVTTPSLYGTFGLALPLRLLDIKRSLNNYFEYGITDIFLYLESSAFLHSIHYKDPNFSSFNVTGGIKVQM